MEYPLEIVWLKNRQHIDETKTQHGSARLGEVSSTNERELQSAAVRPLDFEDRMRRAIRFDALSRARLCYKVRVSAEGPRSGIDGGYFGGYIAPAGEYDDGKIATFFTPEGAEQVDQSGVDDLQSSTYEQHPANNRPE